MKGTMTEQILSAHLVDGDLQPGGQILVRVDQVLLQDVFAPQIMAQFESMGLARVRVPLAAAYCDHEVYQFSHENTDDHRYLRDVCRKYGLYWSAPGYGICHQVHAERFGAPGTLLVDSDSHTTQGGGLGAFATGMGGQDVLQALVSGGVRLRVPEVVQVHLTGHLQDWVTAKDLNLELLRRLTAKGGLGKALEFGGPGVTSLSAQDRLTIANMAVELSATAALFPSDEVTLEFLRLMDRAGDFRPLAPQPGAEYADRIEIDLSSLVPLVARPGHTDDVVRADEAGDVDVDQVIVGSCTNGSYHDMVVFVGALEAFGGRVAPGLDAIVAPSSFAGAQRFVEEGYGARLFRTGARLSESTCGACLGVGHVPAPGSVSVRTFNRNFSGRSGLPRDRVYLSSPVTAAAAAATGRLVDPRTLAKGAAAPRVAVRGPWPEPGPGLLAPATPEEARALRPRRPGGLASVPMLDAMPRTLRVRVVCRLGDDISTDDIQPSSTIMLWRAEPAAAARTILGPLVPDLPDRCDAALSACGAAALVAGHNYGQGSSREQAALGQRLLGIRLVIASSIARIHRQNLINFGVLPCVWDAPGDPQAPAAGAGDAVQPGDVLVIEDLDRQLLDAPPAGGTIVAWHEGRQCAVTLRHDLNAYEREVVLAGGFLNHLRDHPVQDSTANSIRDAGG